jgi:hypothetical protein
LRQPSWFAPQANGGASAASRTSTERTIPGPGVEKEELGLLLSAAVSFLPGGPSAGTGNWNFKQPLRLIGKQRSKLENLDRTQETFIARERTKQEANAAYAAWPHCLCRLPPAVPCGFFLWDRTFPGSFLPQPVGVLRAFFFCCSVFLRKFRCWPPPAPSREYQP